MTTIWKFEFTDLNVPGTRTKRMPEDSAILHVGAQGETPCIWALVDDDKPMVVRAFELFWTGTEMPKRGGEDDGHLKYLGTCQTSDGLVWHVFERLR